MANFVPLKNYMFYCLDRLIEDYELTPPFLDIGCGIGDLSAHLALMGWRGKAIDSSEIALKEAENNLKLFPGVLVSKESLFEENGSFKTIFIWDVLEHIKDDETALRKIQSLLLPGGALVISVPGNPKEWRWDDDFYGHYRRYTKDEMEKKLTRADLKPVIFWDFTYPFFWIMRRLYTYFRSSPGSRNEKMDKETKTSVSSTTNAWDIPVISGFLNKENFLWRILYKLQFYLFRHRLDRGFEMLVLAQKLPNKTND
jgi:SAM-dependent methyltransferase